MQAKFTGIALLIALFVSMFNVVTLYASPNQSHCDMPLDPVTARFLQIDYDAESDLTIGLLGYHGCDDMYTAAAIVVHGKADSGLADLYQLPDQDQLYGDFFQGQSFTFWYYKPEVQAEISDRMYILFEDGSEVHVFKLEMLGQTLELVTDPSDDIKDGNVFLDPDLRLGVQDGYGFTFRIQPYGSYLDVQHRVYMPVVDQQ